MFVGNWYPAPQGGCIVGVTRVLYSNLGSSEYKNFRARLCWANHNFQFCPFLLKTVCPLVVLHLTVWPPRIAGSEGGGLAVVTPL